MITQEWVREHFQYIDGQLVRVKSYGSSGRHRRLGIPVGSVDKQGYLTTMVLGKVYKLHRLIWFYFNGNWPSRLDHVNQIKSDNRIENLRECSLANNSWNAPGSSKRKSKFKGVYRDSDSKLRPWKAQVNKDGARFYVGRFATEKEAADAREILAKQLHGEFYSR